MVAPLAIIQFFFVVGVAGTVSSFSVGTEVLALLLLSGVVTAVPLLFFGAATRRLPLSYIGFLQFLTPILAFFYGWLIEHELMSPIRWLGFFAVWIAVLIIIGDMITSIRQQRKTRGEFRDVDIPVTGEIGVVSLKEQVREENRSSERCEH